ncbi:MAG: sulfate adenylyltransferase subunit CysN [Polyangiaceae bacterium]|nr:sulfate adenylyltransferase subunit CysN [Polyangiaceae bacterium]
MTQAELLATDIATYLQRHQEKELLRFVAVGSVDDGKSTLIGRLLHDTQSVYEDQLSAVKKATKGDLELDFSLFTDGLKAEREQGITIDVAYRYFTTDRRKFIIADTPGHVQYTRNMATGASTADVAIILIDARLGVLAQSRRHAYIASLLGIPELAVCVNKMDLVGWDEARFRSIERELRELTARLSFRRVTLFPVSALRGDNVAAPSDSAPWYAGGTLLEFLESVPVHRGAAEAPFRYPVQWVSRPNLDYRGFAGQIASGTIRRGDEVVALPSGKRSRVTSIDTFEGELEAASAPLSVTLRLADEIDVSRGDQLALPQALPRVGTRCAAMLVWMSERPLDRGKSFLLKHTTRFVRAEVTGVDWVLDLETLDEVPAEGLGLNDLGRVTIACHRPLFFDPYREIRGTGAFILVDSVTHDTVAAGMILGPDEGAATGSGEALLHSQVSATERERRLGHRGRLVVLVGAQPALRQRLAWSIERALFDRGRVATVVEAPATDALAVGHALERAGLVAVVPLDTLPVAEHPGGRLVIELDEAAPGADAPPLRRTLDSTTDVEALAAELVALADPGSVG